MKYFCRTLNKSFETKESMFKELKANEEKIINLKKAAIQKSAEKGQYSPSLAMLKLNESAKDSLNMEDGYVYPVINTTKYMDSHDDVHFDGIWNKSLKDNRGKIYYVADHNLNIGSVIAYPKNVNAFVKMLPWSVVGKDFEGETQALVYKIKKDDIVHEGAKRVIEDKHDIQNSVRMQYVKIKFAVNSDSKDYAENKAYFDAKIDSIANKEEVLEQGYFYGVEEAKIHKEGSMVLFGSNDATPLLQSDEPSKDTQDKDEPPKGTRKNLLLNYI